MIWMLPFGRFGIVVDARLLAIVVVTERSVWRAQLRPSPYVGRG